jgi:hypothetical protein
MICVRAGLERNTRRAACKLKSCDVLAPLMVRMKVTCPKFLAQSIRSLIVYRSFLPELAIEAYPKLAIARR